MGSSSCCQGRSGFHSALRALTKCIPDSASGKQVPSNNYDVRGRLGRWARPSRVNLFARIIIITKTVKILDALFLRWVSCFIEVSEISITFRSFDRSTCKILLHDLSSANLQCFVVTFSLNSSPATDRICPSLTRGLEDWTHSDAHWVIWSVTTTDFLLE